MREFIQKHSTLLASFALFFVTLSVNNACYLIIHQPKLPASAKKYRKF